MSVGDGRVHFEGVGQAATTTYLAAPVKLGLDTHDGTIRGLALSGSLGIVLGSDCVTYTCVFPLPVSIWRSILVSGRVSLKEAGGSHGNDDVLLEALLEHLALVGPRSHGDGRGPFLVWVGRAAARAVSRGDGVGVVRQDIAAGRRERGSDVVFVKMWV